MAELPIIKLPDPLLKQPSAAIETIDASVLKLADDMLDTMYKAVGVGLAAVQVGVLKRLVVLDVSDKEDVREPMVFINPEIVGQGDQLRIYEEGCLSIPDFRVEVERPAEVKVSYIDREGKPQIVEASGLLATALQHEIDHLNGKLIIDYLSKLRRDMVVRKFKKIARG